MRSPQTRRASLAVLLVALAAACASTKGTVSGGSYRSPLDDFSLPVPQLGPGLRIDDGVSSESEGPLRAAWVSFHDDFGNLVAIESAEMPAELGTTLADPARLRTHLERVLDEGYLPMKRELIPTLTASHRERITLSDGEPALFVVVDFPGGSPLVAMNAENPQGKRMDSTRPTLLCVHGSRQYVLAVSHDFVLGSGTKATGATADEQQLARWKAELAEVHGSVAFR